MASDSSVDFVGDMVNELRRSLDKISAVFAPPPEGTIYRILKETRTTTLEDGNTIEVLVDLMNLSHKTSFLVPSKPVLFLRVNLNPEHEEDPIGEAIKVAPYYSDEILKLSAWVEDEITSATNSASLRALISDVMSEEE